MEFPRHVHKPGVHSLIVESAGAFEAALADGWSAEPVAVRLRKGDEVYDAYTPDQIAVALAQGWAVEVAEAPASAPVLTPAPVSDAARASRGRKAKS